MKFAIFLQSSLLFSTFYLCSLLSSTLLFVLKRSYICYYVLCMTVPLRWRMLQLMPDYWAYIRTCKRSTISLIWNDCDPEGFWEINHFHLLHSFRKQEFSSFLPSTALLRKDSVKAAVPKTYYVWVLYHHFWIKWKYVMLQM